MSNIIELSAFNGARSPKRVLASENVEPYEPREINSDEEFNSGHRRTGRRMVFRSYALIVQSDEADLMRDVCFDLGKAQTKLEATRRQLQRDREHAAAREKLLTSAENRLSAAIDAVRSLTDTPAPRPEVKQPRTKNGTPEERAKKEAKAAAPPPATVTQLPRPRGSMLDHEFRAMLEELDESGRQFINGYMQALLDQRGLR
jgi:hypothetical protein